MQLEGIDHVAVGVREIERSAKWYIDVLGFERVYEGMWDGVPTFIGKGNTGIALFPARSDAESTSSSHRELRMLHLAFRANRNGFLAAQKELKRRGIDHSFHILVAKFAKNDAKPTMVWRAVGHQLKDYAAFLEALRTGKLDDRLAYPH